MFTLHEPPLFARLAGARKVLIAGAGGGFDVYAGLPLALALSAQGKEVHRANLSFADLTDTGGWLAQDVVPVTPDSAGPADYFPERTLARWLESRQLPTTVHALRRVGPRRLRAWQIAREQRVRSWPVNGLVGEGNGPDRG